MEVNNGTESNIKFITLDFVFQFFPKYIYKKKKTHNPQIGIY